MGHEGRCMGTPPRRRLREVPLERSTLEQLVKRPPEPLASICASTGGLEVVW